MIKLAINLIPYKGTVIEFCAGGGYLGITLAQLRPDINVIITDMNQIALSFAEKRIVNMGLKNITIIRSELSLLQNDISILFQNNKSQNFKNNNTSTSTMATITNNNTIHNNNNSIVNSNTINSNNDNTASATTNNTNNNFKFHLGITLHACGSATDVIQDICLKHRASFVIAPCCYGFLQHWIDLPVSRSNMNRDPTCHCQISHNSKINNENNNRSSRNSSNNDISGSTNNTSNTNNTANSNNNTSTNNNTTASTNNNINTTTTNNNASHIESNEIFSPIQEENNSINSELYIDKDFVSKTQLSYPRSQYYHSQHVNIEFFRRLCHRADRTFFEHDTRSIDNNPIGKIAMKAIDTDRILYARESGLYTLVTPYFMTPLDASPKNHILVGIIK